MKLRVEPDGTVRGLWTDDVDWSYLGTVTVRRASHVEFCNRRQMWNVRAGRPGTRLRRWLQRLLHRPFGEIVHWAKTRQDALEWEGRHFEPGGPGWSNQDRRRANEATCEGCDGTGVRYPATPSCAFVPADTAGWDIVEKCDTCDRFADDLAAAKAVFCDAKWITCTGGGHHAVRRNPRRVGPLPKEAEV